MRFTKVSEGAFARFIERQERVTFTQTPAYLNTRRNQGYAVELFGVVDGEPERLVAAAAVLFQPWKRVFRRAHIAFGPVLEQFDSAVLQVFFTGLRDALKKDPRTLSVRFNPLLSLREYDDVEPGPETAEAKAFQAVMAELGAERVNREFYDSPDIQVRFSYVKDLAGMDFKQAHKSAGQQVRTAFNRKGTNGVEVRFVSPDQINILADVLAETAERTDMHEVSDASINYYRELAKHLGPDHAFLPVAVLNCPTYLKQLADERKEVEERASEIQRRAVELSAEGKNLSKRQRNQLKELESRLEVLDRRESETRQVQVEHGDEVILAASFFIHSPGELLYLVSGAHAEFNSYYGIYLIHREMFEWATENNVRYYNFFGITGDFSDEASDAGVLHFKRQFVGDVEEYVGTYDLPVHKLLAKATQAIG